MGVRLLALIIAAFSGVTMALQGSLNASLSKVIGLWETTFVVHLIGLIVITLLLFVFKLGDGNLTLFSQAPWYTFLGGILGVLIIYTVARSIPKVGVAPATTAIILGQVFSACVIDHLGLFGLQKIPFTWCNVLGTLLMAGGAWLILRQ
ncbi:DMT family transporter [Desulfolucanica intricata]|uniref:DMT family transporter n=1 Tax=Desulfolucanica intricata TaxID=1285191 RepID=UPI00082AAD4D|nr:DMT family transporter [Desulfolucanica intricata]